MSADDVCLACHLYRRERGGRIRAEIAKTSRGREAQRRWHKFMADVHDRHRITPGRVAALMALIAEETDNP